MDGAVKETDGAQKRNTLEDLNKEDLIKKCKSLLIIAQRAKQAKDEAGEEVKRLKEQLNNGERNSDTDRNEKDAHLHKELGAMQEMLGTLTEQKLQFTMEVDKLKKENVLLEKQLNHLKMEEAKVRETSVQLQSRLEELETAAESYKRQTHRLTNENEALLQQMETMEMEMKKKEEQTSRLSEDRVKLLEDEVQTLRDEVERLTEEDARKKDQMKQLYESFSKEKSELESRLEEDVNKIKNLLEDLKVISKEKESILIHIGNVEGKNIELQKLVADIHAERDSLAAHSGKLNEEREITSRHLESIEVEKKKATDENDCLRSENQRLNQLFDDASKELRIVKSENSLLKMEKQEFNEKICSVLNDREKLTSELQHAERKLRDILRQTRSNLQQYEVLKCITEEKEFDGCDNNDGEQNSSLSNIISSLHKDLTQLFSLTIVEVKPIPNSSNKSSDHEEQESQINQPSDIKNGLQSVLLYGIISKGKDDFIKLYSELKLLNVVISNLEAEGELLQTENIKLKESLNRSTKLKPEGILPAQESGLEALLRHTKLVIQDNDFEEGGVGMHLKWESSEEVVQLQKELDICQKSLETKSLEVDQLKKNLEEQFAQLSETDGELRNELNGCRQTLSKKITELGLVQEELAFVLGKQRGFGCEQREMDMVRSGATHSNKCVEEKTEELANIKDELSGLCEQQHCSQSEIERLQNELIKVTEDFGNASALVKSLNKETADLESNVNKLQNELVASRESKACLESCLDKLHKEKASVDQELADFKRGPSLGPAGIEELKEKTREVANCKANAVDAGTKLDAATMQQQFSDKCILLEGSNIKVEELKEKIAQYEREKTNLINETTKLNNLLIDMKNVVDQNAACMKNKNSEIEGIKEELKELDEERIKLRSELEEKSRLLDEKEETIGSIRQKLKDVDIRLKTAVVELQEKVQSLENEVQIYKTLFEKECRGFEVAKEELERITLSSVRISDEAALKAKDKEIETLKIALQLAESNIAEALIKFKDQESELFNAQNHAESMKTELSDLRILLEVRTSELSGLQISFEEKCLELDSVKRASLDAASELEVVKNESERSRVNYAKAESDLKEQLDEANCRYNKNVVERECVLKKETEQLQSNRTRLQNELVDTQEQYSKKAKELDSVTEEFHCLQSQFSHTQEELKFARSQYDDVLKDLEYMKNELQLANDRCERTEEELRVSRSCCDEKTNDLESLSSELVNVENTSAEAVSRLIAVTTELDTVKDAHLTSTRKLNGATAQLGDVTMKLAMKEEELQDCLKQLEETRQASNMQQSETQQMTTRLVSLSSTASGLNALRIRMSEEVRAFQFNILNTLQKETWIGIQKAVTSYVESETAVTKRENAELLGEMNEMNQVLKQRGETISKLKEINSDQEQRLRETTGELQRNQEELKIKLLESGEKDKTLCKLEMDLAKVTRAQEENVQMKDETIHMLEKEVMKFMECQHELETKTSALEAKEERIHNLEAELTKQSERLQELKSKDKIIHELEDEIKILKALNKAENNGSRAENHDTRVKELEDEISALRTRIQLLEHETEEIRKENGDAPSEAMSSSTISRAEESARLKDLEETFEERYTKLRIVAVRLKKKVSELTTQQTQLETEKKKLSTDKADLQAKVTQLSAHAKNLQTMQLEYDRLQDDLERQKSEVKDLTKTLELSVNESSALKVQLHECQEEKKVKVSDLEACLKDKQKLELASRELSSHIHALKKEKEAENVARREKEKEFKRLEDELKAGEKRLAEEIDHHKNTQEMLEASRQECKKRSVLSLEMEDYERSVADLTRQLAAERSKVKELENYLETQRDISRGLQEQISLLEQRIQSEEARSKEVKEQLNSSRAKLLEVEALALEREASISELASQIEEHKDKNENLVLQLSELAVEKQRLVESGRNQQDGLSRQVHVLEDHVSRLKESLAEREAELGDLRAEFGSYKVRAQSVLRQKARPDDESSSFSREDHMEEVAQLRQATEILRSKLEDASSKLQTLEVENNAVQEDRARVLQRCQELLDTVQDLRNQNSQLHTQLQEVTIEHREALRSQKLQAETLNQCYKQQIEELEEKLQKETSSLKKKLQEIEEQLDQHSSAVGNVGHVLRLAESNVLSTPIKRNSSHHWSSSTAGFVPVKSAGVTSQQDSENKLEIALLEREEGEGSESVDSTSPHLAHSQERRTELIPLDKLLSSVSDDDNNALTVDASPSVELGRTKEQLVVSECRIRHLTGLLSEAERDLARLTQQNQVLKEEIRRQQRSVEREQHAQNFEYLKNVVLKFVTLQGGDERSRLVPVLNTILKLSPEETNQLNIVANGGPDLQGGGRGWGSYLHLWSGTQ